MSTWTAADTNSQGHDDVIKWKHFPRYWPFVRRSYQSPVGSPHKGHWRGTLMCLWSAPEQAVEQTIETPGIWDAIFFIMTSLQCVARQAASISNVLCSNIFQWLIVQLISPWICHHLSVKRTGRRWVKWVQPLPEPCSRLILCLRPTNERRRYFVTTSLIG